MFNPYFSSTIMGIKNKRTYLEKYSVAPCPSRDYYGIKVHDNEVIWYKWKVSHGPHVFPTVRIIKFCDFEEHKDLHEEIEYIFGPQVLQYLERITTEEHKSLLTLPQDLVKRLIRYLNLKDIVNLFCLSKLSKEIFDKNDVWEIILKREKGSSKLSEMEKDLSVTYGFKKLAKDQHIRNSINKNIKYLDETRTLPQKNLHTISNRSEVSRSASINIPKTKYQNDLKVSQQKPTPDDSPRKTEKLIKSPRKTVTVAKEKKVEVRKKLAPAERLTNNLYRKNVERYAGGEGYPRFEDGKDTKSQPKLTKYKFVNEENEKIELMLRKNYLKSAIAQSDASDIDSDELNKTESMLMKHQVVVPRSPASGDGGAKAKRKLRVKAIKDEPEESGMSYLMKRYLEASDEVAKRFTESDRLTTRSSGIQVNMPEKIERRPVVRNMTKRTSLGHEPLTNKNTTHPNVFSRLKTVKKN